MNRQSIPLSVIIPTCNRLDTLARAINSLILQGIDDLEIIIVDDSPHGQIEDICAIVNSNAFFLKHCLIIRNDGKHSASCARNVGVHNATGEYITFLDDDDIYLDGRLKAFLEHIKLLQQGQYSFISSCRVFEYKNFSDLVIPPQTYGVIKFVNNIWCNEIDIGILVSRKLFIKIGGFNESLTSLEDWDLINRLLCINDGFKIKRYDYVANMDNNRVRVTQREGKGYLELVELYKNKYGIKWKIYMSSIGFAKSKQLTFIKAVSFSLISLSVFPFKQYVKMLLGRA